MRLAARIDIPILRWGRPYESLETQNFVHFHTGEPLAKVSQANSGLLAKDLQHAQRARDLLREIPVRELIARMAKAAELFKNAALPIMNPGVAEVTHEGTLS